ncbi:hypothetical protein [Metabacillus sp. 84]|uniref:hypothetical protein n=1 Tax=unclassified Metabacillus TaxID=2675274 RepID=UPI003CF3C22F
MRKTERMMKQVLVTATASIFAIGMSGCSSQSADRPDPPDDQSCDDWEWDNELEVWECDDDRSPHYGHFFYGGAFFATANALKKSSKYKSYVKGGKSGIGSGTRGGFGG